MFLNPEMLAGIGGAAVPLVLHLLARSRYRNVEWGAMMFLTGARPQQFHSARLKQWGLLGIRMVLVGLIAAALARPVVRGHWGALGSEGRITAVILLDCSASMAVQEAGLTRFDKARDAVLQILSNLRKGDEVALVVLGEQVEVRAGHPTGNLQMVAREVAELSPSSGLADIAGGLEVARGILGQPARGNRELYLVCDRQAAGWRGLEGRRDLAARDGERATRFYVVPVGGEETENLTIESVELVESVAIRRQPAEVEVHLRNYSDSPRVGAELSLGVIAPGDGWRRAGEPARRLKTVPVTVPARGTASVRVPITLDQTGSHVLIAQVKAPGAGEHRFESVMDVIDPIDVLVISGDEGTLLTRRESFFLRLALTPYQSAQARGQDVVSLTIVRPEEWGSVNLNKHQVIILANVPRLTSEQAKLLEQRVYEGAGLIVAPGNLVRAENYNAVLWREGQGMLPAPLEGATAPDGSEKTVILGLEPGHPVFRFQRGQGPPGTTIGRYFRTGRVEADARVLGTYRSGDAFLIERPTGSGRVLLLTTPLDADWSGLPVYEFYLPFVQSLVRYACGSSQQRNLQPGQPILVMFDTAMEGAELRRYEEVVHRFGRASAGTRLRFAQTQRPGIYRMQARFGAGDTPRKVLHFVVQPPAREADLTCLTPGEWRKHEEFLGFRRLEGDSRSLVDGVTQDRGGRELWLTLLSAAVVLGVIEVLLARLWSREGS